MPVPIEQIVLPARLDGRDGVNRARSKEGCQIVADSDIDAIRTWLSEFHDSPETLRAYRKEAERLLLWAMLERGKAFSSLAREDLIAYETFLEDPRPRARWCGPRRPRSTPEWRPFEGPLKASSRRQTLVILNALFSYLTAAGYLAGNPLTLVRRRKRRGQRSGWHGHERHLEREAWSFVLDVLDRLPEGADRAKAHKERLRFLLAALYLLGPRVSEIASHSMGSLYQRRGRWWWRVVGKGEKEAKVPVNDELLNALRRYRTFRGLSPLPQPGDTAPLIASVTGVAPISPNMVYRIVKQFFGQVAEAAREDHPDWVETFQRVSTHWLRHTSLTHQADAGLDLRYLNRNARHSSIETTGLYLHAEDAAWHEAMEKLHLRPSASEKDV